MLVAELLHNAAVVGVGDPVRVDLPHRESHRTDSEIVAELNDMFAERDLLQFRSFGYGHSFGVLSHYYGREAGLELREDNDIVLESGMVVSMEPMLLIPEGQAGAGGYREHDILVINSDGADNITGFPFGPDHNVVGKVSAGR